MSWTACPEMREQTEAPRATGVKQVLVPRTGDIGGFEVARALPSRERRMVGPRYLWWNLVASDRERLRAARADGDARRFDPVPGDDERIELPGRPDP